VLGLSLMFGNAQTPAESHPSTEVSFTDEEKAEIERSAVDAARRTEPIVMDRSQLARYADPPADTIFPLEYAFHLLGPVHGKTILDYGCGAGEDLVFLAARGGDVIGLDISPELIELARKRAEVYNVNARFIVGSGYETGLPTASVDIIFAIAIFHHLDLDAAKKELCRVLRPNGVIILKEPVRDSAWLSSLLSAIPYDKGDISPFEKPHFSSFRQKGKIITEKIMENKRGIITTSS